jgi:hypothetical protein
VLLSPGAGTLLVSPSRSAHRVDGTCLSFSLTLCTESVGLGAGVVEGKMQMLLSPPTSRMHWSQRHTPR